MTLEIHAFGLDDTIHHNVLVSTYLFTEQNFNTSTLFPGRRAADVRREDFKKQIFM